MYLSAYHFDGDPAELAEGHERMLAFFPPDSLSLHALLVRPHGITVLDACPSEAIHAEFAASPEFQVALAQCRLPQPRVEGLGDVTGPVIVASEAVRA